MIRHIRIGTRGSALARWQTEHVAQRLQARWPDLEVEIVLFTTRGDREQHRPLPEIGGKGLFTAELEAALRAGEIDLAVHSLKDLPTRLPADLTIAAVLPREDPHDVLISRHASSLEELPPHPTIGTSSTRRAAQVRLARPDATVLPLRGNVDTRVRKALDPEGPYDAVILARAGVVRLGLEAHVTQVLPFDVMLPAPGQGALAVQCRADNEAIRRLVQPLDDPHTRAAVTAERAFLQGLGGGCAQPIAALGEIREGTLHLRGLFVTPEGEPVRVTGTAPPEAAAVLGYQLADEVRQQLARGSRSLHPAPALSHEENQPSSTAHSGTSRLKVLILRAEEQAGELAAAVQDLGMEPVVYPTIRIHPPERWDALDEALRRLAGGAYDWLVLTSANGVRYVWDRLATLGLALPPSLRVAVIGPATARALAERGVTADVMPKAYVAEALVEALGDVRGASILLARADRARPTLREQLVARGANVDEVTAYRTVIAPPSTPPPMVDIIAFTSPSTVEGFLTASGGRLPPPPTRVVCIGPITARAARTAGLPVHAEATEYTIAGVVEAIRRVVQHMSEDHPRES